MTEQTATDLLSILEQERGALRAGQIDRLQDLTQQKIALVDRLVTSGSAPDRLSLILSVMGRNERLLKSACDGIGAANARLAEMRSVKSNLSYYSSAGKKSNIRTPDPSLERRA
ncbi:flagellar biosynthesis protein FlgN [Loktanella sp. SALINAS62]|uniref:flagellar biosynthesis protein FlgN n=1 Tax=Loktanella sp. SALINAS62 TaxID=2706124 RepID=UPI001B8D7D99|nr:flagellar biosynthesis protein FlgN [Loktanella sp. SALINAS62]MBS1301870.1 flagellar protein FlgN [Loktanella sp. SALINAS62]